LKARGLDSRGLSKLLRTLLGMPEFEVAENLGPDLMHSLRLPGRAEALKEVHQPGHPDRLKRAEARLKFEELFFLQLWLLKHKHLRKEKSRGIVFPKVGEHFNAFYSALPFPLTAAQKNVMREIRKDLGSGKQMNRLLQGDVGSGKTLVALMSMLIAIDNGCQACIMAPTEILAGQHFNTLRQFLQEIPVNIGLLTGSTRQAERRKLHSALEDGSLHILVGTHALLEDNVKFRQLGLVVIDEQHRFGVEQRARLWEKGDTPPHILVMTATPIPRTLAMTLYGHLDYSVIDELPPGRKPVKTLYYTDRDRLKVFHFMRQQIAQGRQIYIVYPLIQESEALDLKDLMDGYESIVREFPAPEFAVSIVHGRMKPADKDYEMLRFKQGETQIMVATTVIEVGVDIPNASVMVIENAERFGLSQLHQLRGRVGRGADQSYCLLMSSLKLTTEARTRLKTMVESTDGFLIADVDMRLRGPGDMMGTRQSGNLDIRIADLVKDEKILTRAREEAIRLLDSDPGLEKPENLRYQWELQDRDKRAGVWSRIL
ncbi:MAG TPA: ATP-dependent DNA helicase RecG, partial [Bacteroidales bacterium]|nr:ATP-dependent DNA helicase RecG [Bacteroidales bacterium]